MKTPIFDFATLVVAQEVGPVLKNIADKSEKPVVHNFVLPASLALLTIGLVGSTVVNDAAVNVVSFLLTPLKKKREI